MPEQRAATALTIEQMTVRGARLGAQAGAALARSVALALAQGPPPGSRTPEGAREAHAHVAAITLRVPASAVGPHGVIDQRAVAEAVARWRAGSAGAGGRHA